MKNHFNTTFLFALIILVGYGSYLIIKPFLIAVVVAFVVSQLFKNWYKKINKAMKNRKSLASMTTCLILLVLIFIPLIFITSLVISETNDLLRAIEDNNIREKIETFSVNIHQLGINLSNDEIQSIVGTEEFTNGLKNAGGLLLTVIAQTYQSTVNFLFMTFVMFFSLYYFFKDGDLMLRRFMALSPLKDSQERLLVKKFIEISRATLKGSLVIALIQGILIGVIFAIAGVTSATLWGLITVLLSLIPLLGSVLVWAPVGIFLLLVGKIWQGLFIIIIGAVIVSSVDNLLRPKLVGDETQLHPLLVFLSTLGGIAFFGISGFLLGPVIVVLLITLLHIYQIEFKDDLKVFNK